MKYIPLHLKALEELEREGIPGLVEVLRDEGIDAVHYIFWDAIGWHRDFDETSLATNTTGMENPIRPQPQPEEGLPRTPLI